MVNKPSGNNKNNYKLKLIEHVYNQLPAFTDIFTEETFYQSVACFVAFTVLLAFLLSRYVTIKPVTV